MEVTVQNMRLERAMGMTAAGLPFHTCPWHMKLITSTDFALSAGNAVQMMACTQF
jgi:hypothetical protein